MHPQRRPAECRRSGRAGAGWTLHAPDGAAVEVYVNGNLVGLLGAAGAPVLGRRVDAIAAAALQAVDCIALRGAKRVDAMRDDRDNRCGR